MKVKRQKKANRLIQSYELNFGFKSPFQVIIDGTFSSACLAAKVNIREQLEKYLVSSLPSSNCRTSATQHHQTVVSPLKLLTTVCCVNELAILGRELGGALAILKQFPLHKCGHGTDPLPAAKCIRSLIKKSHAFGLDGHEPSQNRQHYFVASQDEELRARLRAVPGTPIVYLHNCAPTLERQSDATLRLIASQEQSKLERSNVVVSQDSHGAPARFKRKKRGNPNPLSCLPSKKVKKAKKSSFTA